MSEIVRKEFKFNKETITKIEKLKYLKSQENGEIKTYEKDVLVEAIDYMYSSKLGKDVFDHTMTKLELVIGNRMTKIMNEYIATFATAIENVYLQNEQLKEMMIMFIRSNNIIPMEQEQINSVIMKNDELDKYVKEAILFKREMHKR